MAVILPSIESRFQRSLLDTTERGWLDGRLYEGRLINQNQGTYPVLIRVGRDRLADGSQVSPPVKLADGRQRFRGKKTLLRGSRGDEVEDEVKD